jgi:hexosaminidase
LWSPREVNDLADMYRRLEFVSSRLEEAGLLHEKNYDPMLRRLAGDDATESERQALRTFVDVLEPVKEYTRQDYQKKADQFMPLTGLVDCARPDSRTAREFAGQVEKFVFAEGKPDAKQSEAIARQLEIWAAAGDCVAMQLVVHSPQLREGAPVAQNLARASRIGLEAIKMLESESSPSVDWRKKQLSALAETAHPGAAVELPVIPAIKLLVRAAANQQQHAQLSTEAWRQLIEPSAH